MMKWLRLAKHLIDAIIAWTAEMDAAERAEQAREAAAAKAATPVTPSTQ